MDVSPSASRSGPAGFSDGSMSIPPGGLHACTWSSAAVTATPAARSFSRAARTLRCSCARAKGAVRSYNTCRNRVCRNEYGCSEAWVHFLCTRPPQPQLLARELLAGLADPGTIAVQRMRDGAHTEFDPAHGCRRQERALLDPQLGNVMIDDGGQMGRNRQVCELRQAVRVAGGARHDLAHQRGHEQRHSVRALVQRTDEGFVPGAAMAGAQRRIRRPRLRRTDRARLPRKARAGAARAVPG